jgi:hypothetical protein
MKARANLPGRILALALFGIALGWFEAAVVVDLRAQYYPAGFSFPLAVIPARIVVVEMLREAASLLILASAAYLAAEGVFARLGAFFALFGVWDLVYYAALEMVLGWPRSLSDWDVLFLIPVPWAGPVWAPCAVSIVLLAAGVFLFATPGEIWNPRALDWLVEILAGCLIVASFLWSSRAILDGGIPRQFPWPLFAVGLAGGAAWFVRVGRRAYCLFAGGGGSGVGSTAD